MSSIIATVSVPLSGLTSVNESSTIHSGVMCMSFRPLIGVNFCKLFKTAGIVVS